MPSNVYFILTNQLTFVKDKIEELNKEKKYEVIYASYPDRSINSVIEQLDTYDFLSPHKILVYTSCTFLSNSVKKKELEEAEKLLKYLKNPNPDHLLILVTDTMSEKTKIAKTVLKEATKIEMPTSFETILKKHLQDYKYDSKFIRTLLYYTNENLDLALSEIEKLKILKIEEKTLTEEDVIKTVRRNIDASDSLFFSLIDAILAKNVKRSLSIYKDLKEMGIEESKILATLSGQIRLMYQVKCLKGYLDKDIMNQTKAKLYPIKKARERGYAYSKEELGNLLCMLADMDYKIKTSMIDKSLLMEMFIYQKN